MTSTYAIMNLALRSKSHGQGEHTMNAKQLIEFLQKYVDSDEDLFIVWTAYKRCIVRLERQIDRKESTMLRTEIEPKIDDIDRQIAELKQERERILHLDPDYSAYLDRCEARHRLPEHIVSIRTFYHYLDKLRAIEQDEPDEPENAILYWRRVRREYRRLEQELCF